MHQQLQEHIAKKKKKKHFERQDTKFGNQV